MSRASVLIIQNHPVESLGRYEAFLAGRDIDHAVCHAYRDERFPSLAEFDALMVGGTPTSVYNPRKPSFFRREIAFISEAVRLSKPCLGVCGGGQMLASILGAQVSRNPVKEIGCYRVRLTQAGRASRFFEGFPSEFPVVQWHGDTFETPPGTELLAEAEDCRNQAFSHENSLALQFHLEVTSRMLAQWAEEYSEELEGFGGKKADLVRECGDAEQEMSRLSDRLMTNFLAGCPGAKASSTRTR